MTQYGIFSKASRQYSSRAIQRSNSSSADGLNDIFCFEGGDGIGLAIHDGRLKSEQKKSYSGLCIMHWLNGDNLCLLEKSPVGDGDVMHETAEPQRLWKDQTKNVET